MKLAFKAVNIHSLYQYHTFTGLFPRANGKEATLPAGTDKPANRDTSLRINSTLSVLSGCLQCLLHAGSLSGNMSFAKTHISYQ